MKAVAIIPAAGMGVRMGGKTPKQFLTLQGQAILAHTLKRFKDCDAIDSVVLVVPESEIPAVKEQYIGSDSPVSQVVAGGAERQDSVRNGFRALDSDVDIVVVHDGVRPFASPEMIRQSIVTAQEHGAAICALPVSDTLRKGDADGFVKNTVERDGLWRMQTPQTFRYDWFKEACDQSEAKGFYGTDEGALMEYIGKPVKLVTGSAMNIKITRPEDLELAEKIAELFSKD